MTTQPIKPPAAGPVSNERPPVTDGTLTITPHAVAVAAGLITGWMTTKIGLSPAHATYASIVIATLITTAVHFIQAKIDE